VELTTGHEEGEGGSDSAPSEDNLESEELATLVPLSSRQTSPVLRQTKVVVIKSKPIVTSTPLSYKKKVMILSKIIKVKTNAST
jgi:hypothetical protein